MTLVAMLIVGLVWAFRGKHDRRLYRVTILSSLGGRVTTPTAINNRGQIVGYSEALDGSCHLCLWDPNGSIQDLGPATQALFHINDTGQIAGTALGLNGREVAFLWDCAQGLRLLGTLGGAESVARGLNNRGQVVGWSRTAAGLKHAFVWDRTTGMQDLGPAEGDGGEARAINDSGQIIGVLDGRASCPALWTPAGSAWTAEPLESLLGSSDINNHGYTAGRQRFPLAGEFMVRWRSGDPTILFPMDYPIAVWPVINDVNQILFAESHRRLLEPITAGRLVPSSTEYWIWDPNRGRVPLNPQALARRGETFEAFDLNDKGCIVGRVVGYDWSGRITYVRPVLLEPIPERWGRQPVRGKSRGR